MLSIFIILLFIILFIVLSFVNNYMELYSEHFISNTNQECKVPSKKYRATCDKKNIYNILSNLETDISKIKYRVIREKTKSAEYDEKRKCSPGPPFLGLVGKGFFPVRP